MKRLFLAAALTLSLGVCGGALANGQDANVQRLAEATGLTNGEVRMLLGARTPSMEYMTSYERAQKRLAQSVGKARARALLAGEKVRFDNGLQVRLTSWHGQSAASAVAAGG